MRRVLGPLLAVLLEGIRRGASCLLLAGCPLLAGCLAPLHVLRFQPPPSRTQIPPLANPLLLPPADPDFLWEQLADTVDDYFRIAREERIQRISGVVTEGTLETVPEIGATFLEPWRDDSTPGYERWLATLQSVRRTAHVHVVPVAEGYRVSIEVLKELEDLSHPENSTVGSLVDQREGPLTGPQASGLLPPVTIGWIPIGRDISLEQVMLAELSQRVAGAHPSTPAFSSSLPVEELIPPGTHGP